MPDGELISAMYDALAAGDLEAFSDGLHPDVVWEHNPGGGSLEEGTYHGRDDVLRLFSRILEPWEYMRIEADEMTEDDVGALLVKGRMRSKHATTAAEIVTPFEQRFVFEGGRLVRGRMTFSRLGSEES